MMMDPHLLGAVQDLSVTYIRAYGHSVVWLPRITKDTPGATATVGRDPIRRQETTFADASFGVGWQALQGGVLRRGYLAPIPITGAILDNAQREVWREEGITLYNGSLLLFDPRTAPALALGDVIVLQNDGRRFQVAPNAPGAQSYTLQPQISFGTTLAAEAALDQLKSDSIVYSIPL